jgi:putative PIN family toxin of toxin-antitoxin system
MTRVLLDANVWVSAALNIESTPGEVVRRIRAGQIHSLLSEPLIGQVVRALVRLKFLPSRVEETELEMRALSELIVPTFTLSVITAKESDNRVLEVAASGQADVIVTGDRRHLLPLGSYAGIPILTPADFLATYPPSHEHRSRR